MKIFNLRYLLCDRNKKQRTEGGFGQGSQRGEHLIIIIIIGVLVAIALPTILNKLDKPRERQDQSLNIYFT